MGLVGRAMKISFKSNENNILFVWVTKKEPILPSCMVIIISQSKDPYQPPSVFGCKTCKKVFSPLLILSVEFFVASWPEECPNSKET